MRRCRTEPERNSAARPHRSELALTRNLRPKTRYYYAVQDGVTSDSKWSETYSFRSMPVVGEKVSIAIFGDMGVYTYNNMANMLDDVLKRDEPIDLVVHAGEYVVRPLAMSLS